jgi:hypothetical protein
MSRRHPITADEVTRVFDDECVRDLCHRYLPRGVDVVRFSEGVRSAAYAYAEDVRARSGDEIRAEIAELLKFANFKRPSTGRTTGVKYEKVARKLEHMSREATRLLTDRSERISWRPEPWGPPVTAIGRNGESLTRECRDGFSVTLPSPDDLRDPSLAAGGFAAGTAANDELIKQLERACEIIRLLCSNGVRPTIEGQAVKYDVYAPQIIYEDRPNKTGGASQRDLIRKRRPKRRARQRCRIRWQ